MRSPTGRSTGSRSTTCSSSTAGSCCCGRTTSARSSTTGRGGSGRTRSSGTTRRCRRARSTRSRTTTGSSRAIASRRSGSCGMPPARVILQWWRGHPSGWWNPADYNVASICVPIATHVPHAAGLAWGKKLRGEPAVAIVYFGDGATSEGRSTRGELRCGHRRAARPLLQQQPVGDLDASVGADARGGVRRQGGRLRDPGHPRRRRRRARRLRGDPRGGRARPDGRRPDDDRGGVRAAPHATADDPSAYIDLERVEEEKKNECVGRYERYLERLGVLDASTAEQVRAEAADILRRGIAEAEAEPPATRRSCSSTRMSTRCRPSPTSSGSCAVAERLTRVSWLEAINDCFHVELGRDENVW